MPKGIKGGQNNIAISQEILKYKKKINNFISVGFGTSIYILMNHQFKNK